jgi:hypothetical protein
MRLSSESAAKLSRQSVIVDNQSAFALLYFDDQWLTHIRFDSKEEIANTIAVLYNMRLSWDMEIDRIHDDALKLDRLEYLAKQAKEIVSKGE